VDIVSRGEEIYCCRTCDCRVLLLLRVQKAPGAPHSTEQRVVTIQPAEEEDGMLLLRFFEHYHHHTPQPLLRGILVTKSTLDDKRYRVFRAFLSSKQQCQGTEWNTKQSYRVAGSSTASSIPDAPAPQLRDVLFPLCHLVSIRLLPGDREQKEESGGKMMKGKRRDKLLQPPFSF